MVSGCFAFSPFRLPRLKNGVQLSELQKDARRAKPSSLDNGIQLAAFVH